MFFAIFLFRLKSARSRNLTKTLFTSLFLFFFLLKKSSAGLHLIHKKVKIIWNLVTFNIKLLELTVILLEILISAFLRYYTEIYNIAQYLLHVCVKLMYYILFNDFSQNVLSQLIENIFEKMLQKNIIPVFFGFLQQPK